MSVAKKTDQEFRSHRTTIHSIRDVNRDIDKMVHVLYKKKSNILVGRSQQPPFWRPYREEANLCNTKWVQETLERKLLDEDIESVQEEHVANIDYKIADII